MTSRSIEQENAIAVEKINISVTASASEKKRGGKRKKVKEVKEKKHVAATAPKKKTVSTHEQSNSDLQIYFPMTSRSIEQENAIAVEEINISVTASASEKKRGGKRKKVKEVKEKKHVDATAPKKKTVSTHEKSARRATTSAIATHSGLENKKIVTIEPADKEQGVVLGITKTKKQNRRKLSVNKFFLKKKFPRMTKAVVN